MNKPKVIAIVGPTSSGKTSLSIKIAKKCNGEVISVDSRQVYRDMDLGSGKVTHAEMDGVPHHLLDIADPVDVYTATDFVRDATTATEDILNRGCRPIFAGGTFFYLDILRGKMQPAPVEPNPTLRVALEKLSTEELFNKLKAADPKRGATIDPENRRRLIRSLEIIDALGTVPEPSPINSPYNWLILGIDISQTQLHRNIHIRLKERLQNGMIEEVRQLHEHCVSYDRLDEFGLEYRYIAKYLQGELTEIEMTEQLEIKIRQFAKRQMTWLKRDNEIEWFTPENHEAIFGRVTDFLSTPTS